MAIALVVGNFIYIGASDLIPKMNNDTTINLKSRAVTLIAFILGIYLLLLVMP
jgi:zinc and cadmium transporter